MTPVDSSTQVIRLTSAGSSWLPRRFLAIPTWLIFTVPSLVPIFPLPIVSFVSDMTLVYIVESGSPPKRFRLLYINPPLLYRKTSNKTTQFPSHRLSLLRALLIIWTIVSSSSPSLSSSSHSTSKLYTLVPTVPDSSLFRTSVGPLLIPFGLTLEYWWCVLVVVLHCVTYQIRGLSLSLTLSFVCRLQPRRTNQRSLFISIGCMWWIHNM